MKDKNEQKYHITAHDRLIFTLDGFHKQLRGLLTHVTTTGGFWFATAAGEKDSLAASHRTHGITASMTAMGGRRFEGESGTTRHDHGATRPVGATLGIGMRRVGSNGRRGHGRLLVQTTAGRRLHAGGFGAKTRHVHKFVPGRKVRRGISRNVGTRRGRGPWRRRSHANDGTVTLATNRSGGILSAMAAARQQGSSLGGHDLWRRRWRVSSSVS
mmetsp:Transcript_3068/g.6298  ORF Transcript_3068/g.6298 Transcript_3068/m.6298 type:complete len:214 (-) Transcript_3068:128-769(-)